MNYWLMKSEPSEFGIDDLEKVGCEPWDGVRNYQVRNMLRDDMQIGDLAFFYHSNCKDKGIVGIMEITTTGYPDSCAWDPEDKHYDPRSTEEKPLWYRVDVKFVKKFTQVLPLSTLKAHPELTELPLVKRGSRLSIMPISEQQWQTILTLC